MPSSCPLQHCACISPRAVSYFLYKHVDTPSLSCSCCYRPFQTASTYSGCSRCGASVATHGAHRPTHRRLDSCRSLTGLEFLLWTRTECSKWGSATTWRIWWPETKTIRLSSGSAFATRVAAITSTDLPRLSQHCHSSKR